MESSAFLQLSSVVCPSFPEGSSETRNTHHPTNISGHPGIFSSTSMIQEIDLPFRYSRDYCHTPCWNMNDK